MLEGGVDLSLVRWVPHDGVGRTVRNGLNFTERGFGLRAPMGASDRGHTAVSQLRAGDIDWDGILADTRWFHTGGIFAGLSETTPGVAREAMEAAHRHGAVVSYDLNYRPSLWAAVGGQARAREVDRELASLVDVILGNEEDFTAALGFEVEGVDETFSALDPAGFVQMLGRVVEAFPNLAVAATSLRRASSATRNDWGGVCVVDGRAYEATRRTDVEVLDRVGGGDSFASGLIYGFISGEDPARALEYAAAHGTLAMTTPGDTSMATLAEVESLMRGESRRVRR
jgi:2-dehydro-3-deoxygluconokinase